MNHTCPDCGATHRQRVKTDRERIADLEAEVARLKAHHCHATCWHWYYWPNTDNGTTWIADNSTAPNAITFTSS